MICLVKLTGSVQEGPKGERRCQPTTLPESFVLKSTLAERCACHQEGHWVRPNMGQARWLARGNPETNPITIKLETASNVAEQFSWVSLPYCSLPRRPFPKQSFTLSVCVFPWTIHCWVLDKSPLLGPGRGLPSCNNFSSFPYPTGSYKT